MDIYLVGGAVRDQLLDCPVTDRDWVVVGATPEQMREQGYRQVGADFPVFLHPHSQEEYALARTERKQGHGYHGFVVYSSPEVTLEDDLARRDLTINAMAQNGNGDIIDPFNGQKDLAERKLRHVSPAFAEDPLRILRTARFAARFAPLGFIVASETQQLMQTMVDAGEADHLVPERVWQETQRALHEKSPAVYFDVLQHCGALARLMAPLDQALAAANTSGDSSPLDALGAACRLSEATTIRFAALIGATGDAAAIKTLKTTVRMPKDCEQLAILAVSQGAKMLPLPKSPQAILNLFNEADAWRRPQRFGDLLTAVEAIARAGNRHLDRSSLERALVAARDVDAKSLMTKGYSGPTMGKAISESRLRKIEAVVADNRAS